MQQQSENPVKTASAYADDPYIHIIQKIAIDPIFILGNHRSGTTLLYQLLDTSERFNVVRAYHIVHQDRLLANFFNRQDDLARAEIDQRLADEKMSDRQLDRVPVSAALPEEYGFLLQAGGRPRLDTENLSRFEETCRKIQYLSDPTKPLLLKNPWDYPNFVFIKQAFPRAKFVFIHRNPAHVINSQLNAARSLYGHRSAYHAMLDPEYAGLWSKPLRLRLIRFLFSRHFGLGFRVTMRSVSRTAHYFLSNIGRINPDNYLEVSYEQLCSAPEETIKRILVFLDQASIVTTIDTSQVRPRTPTLLDEVDSQRQKIFAKLQAYCAHCGYHEQELLAA